MGVILTTPILWLGYGLAVLLCLGDYKLKSPWGLLTLASAAAGVLTTALALVLGASMEEAVCALLVCLLCALPAFRRGEGRK